MSEKIERLFLVAGAMKAGTTWLFSALRGHPQLSTVVLKEIHYFSRGYVPWDALGDADRIHRVADYFGGHGPYSKPETYGVEEAVRDLEWFKKYVSGPVGIEWFKRLFGDVPEGDYLCDFSPFTCLVDGNGIDEIISSSEVRRVMFVIRKPLERYWSHYNFHKSMFNPNDDLNAYSVEEIRDELLSSDFYMHGCYSRFIKIAREKFHEKEFIVKRFEDIVINPWSELANIERFLGVRQHIYGGLELRNKVFETRALNMPSNFIEACRPLIDEEREALESIGFSTPACYWTEE